MDSNVVIWPFWRPSSAADWLVLAVFVLAMFGGTASTVFADGELVEEAKARPEARAAAAFRAAEERHEADTNDMKAAWQFGRATFDLAEYATNNTQRAALAEQGIAATRSVTVRDPKLAAGFYYLGMNLGQLARTKTLGALRLVDEMEKDFKRARGLDPNFDHAGPDRNLGLLYRDAPGWPASVGSKAKALEHLLRAARLDRDFPENRLNLAESYLQWDDTTAARKELEAINKLWPKAKAQLTGAAWKTSWTDWTKRRVALERKLDETQSKGQRLKRGRVPQL